MEMISIVILYRIWYTKEKVKLFNAERMVEMQVLEKNPETLDSVDSAMNLLFSKLDEAIDDMENGRVLTIEEAWKEIDEI